MTLDTPALRARFQRAALAAGASGRCDEAVAGLIARYAEQHRHYHTLAHVNGCLQWLDRLAGVAEHPEEVELAVWFHDAIYEPSGSYNERQSAALARDVLSGLGVVRQRVDRIVEHIEATQHHSATSFDSALVVDIDLSILGAWPADFDAFEEQIRAEYADVPPQLYRVGRCRVLQGFRSRPEIYRLRPIREELEVQARANLERRIRELVAA